MSWVKQKATPNLKEAKAETIVARPSLGKHRLLCASVNDTLKRYPDMMRWNRLRIPDDIGNAGDVDVPGGERGGY